MKEPKNRKERIEFVIQKSGIDVANSLLALTDRQVKEYVDMIYPLYKNEPDYTKTDAVCIRCNDKVIWHSECGCGEDRAVYTEEDWIDDIVSNGKDTSLSPFVKEVNDEFRLKHGL